jgi:hypothetical protein
VSAGNMGERDVMKRIARTDGSTDSNQGDCNPALSSVESVVPFASEGTRGPGSERLLSVRGLDDVVNPV